MALEDIKSFFSSHTVITNQHIRYIETLDKEQNDLLLLQNLNGYKDSNAEESVWDEINGNMSISRSCLTKPVWTRERSATRSIQKDSAGERDVSMALEVRPGGVKSVKRYGLVNLPRGTSERGQV